MIFNNFDQLIDQVRSKNHAIKTVAVVAAEDSHTLEAISHSTKNGFVKALLVGDRQKITEQLSKMDERPSDYTIVHADNAAAAAYTAAQLVNEGQAQFLMKGLIETPTLMKILFNKECGFRTGSLISHICFVKIPNYHKLIGITDVALNIYPNFEQKKAILENAVRTMTRMGFDTPKVAVLAANEHVNPKMPETVDAAELKKMNSEGTISGCIIEGPISYDLTLSKEAADIKRFNSPVPGDVDLLLVPNIAAGNILVKALVYSAEANRAGIVIGAKVPIVLSSRAAAAEDKYLPLVLAASAS
ncbi:bifunctional enoyl-CoA hydratase/phosphate acetyltransferase [Sporomusa acidovorans]|uniref:Phosphate acetyltransferase n=1 Tax=Sporomusa acidovorans (strain ATCC 49682 / DSM 3132 / Mol) TaxID=1123286 RepID=A0ABZ3IXR3_SPOA4|nr:bifunctional enoyl-CoA hydratase/phosphate acetyltransferase [Sporomusa acidovorans]OZC13048.1 phosphate acetyltransferase [Sporomusa acidovorans DSM 3132]SDF51182.1 Phosphate acetyl/butaryl transferase [Sporomusa acidovorans]